MFLSKAENILVDQPDTGHHLPEFLLYATVRLYVPYTFNFRSYQSTLACFQCVPSVIYRQPTWYLFV